MRNLEPVSRKIAHAGVTAAILEASAEKPGNVTPARDHADTSYEDYVAGSLAIGPTLKQAAARGYAAGKGWLAPGEICIGELILSGARDVKASHKGGNTHMGILMLSVPIAAAAGKCAAEKRGFAELRAQLRGLMDSTTIADSYNLYSALEESRAGGTSRLVKKDLALIELMRYSSKRDRVAQELSSGMSLISSTVLPLLEENVRKKKKIRPAVLATYLTILSRYPDTLIEKKAGKNKAEEVSKLAGQAIRGKISLEELDAKLRSRGSRLNPGTTADLVAAALMLRLIKSRRILR